MNEHYIPYGGTLLLDQSSSKAMIFQTDWELHRYVAGLSPVDVLLAALEDKYTQFIFQEAMIDRLRALNERVVAEAMAYKLSLTTTKVNP